MLHLNYSFCMSMLQSLWQAALLLLVYFIIDSAILKKTDPLQKRNFLFLLVSFQILLSLITFIFYFVQTGNSTTTNYIGVILNGILPDGFIQRIAPWLFTAYSIIISYKIIKAIFEWHLFKTKYKTALLKPSVDLKLFTNKNAAHFGIKRKVQLWFSNTINVPVTFGFIKPVIILPVALVNQISLQQAETLILHELSHIKANDYLLNWFLIISETLFFFNPFIKLLCKKIRLEREKNCDSNVVAFAYSPLVYAETLLKAQLLQKAIPDYQLAAVSGKRQLLHRIEFITNDNNFQRFKNPFFLIWLIPSVIILFSSLILLQYHINLNSQKVTVPLNNNLAIVSNSENKSIIISPPLQNFYSENKINSINPASEKQRKKAATLRITNKYDVEIFAEKDVLISNESSLAITTPVALTETDGTLQVAIREEQSGTKNTVLKVYTFTFINGEWTLIPEWVFTAKEINIDSLQNNIDTTLSEK